MFRRRVPEFVQLGVREYAPPAVRIDRDHEPASAGVVSIHRSRHDIPWRKRCFI